MLLLDEQSNWGIGSKGRRDGAGVQGKLGGRGERERQAEKG